MYNPENKTSNYDQVIENWRQKFLEMDQEELIRKFQLEADEEFLYVVYFSRKLRSRPSCLNLWRGWLLPLAWLYHKLIKPAVLYLYNGKSISLYAIICVII